MVPIRQRVQEAAAAVRKAWQAQDNHAEQAPSVIITTGSGLGLVVKAVMPLAFEMSYRDIPHLPPSRVAGHAGRLVIGYLGGNTAGHKVVVLDGRVHGYEGHDPLTQVLPFLIANELCKDSGLHQGTKAPKGARLAIFTNAAGAINEAYGIGDLMIIKDHINFTGQTLLTLNEASDFGGTNLDMTYAYTPRYRTLLKEQPYKGYKLHEGVYLGVRGAQFETPAEIRAFRSWGADVAGMSTVHEVAAASRLDIDVVGISVVTNMAAGIEAKKLTLQEVLENTVHAADALTQLIIDLVCVTQQKEYWRC